MILAGAPGVVEGSRRTEAVDRSVKSHLAGAIKATASAAADEGTAGAETIANFSGCSSSPRRAEAYLGIHLSEKLSTPRHIEFQIQDSHGNVIHLRERQ